jgi:hypothetical protein
MTTLTNRLPRLLKEPTGWVLIVLMAGFFYFQWPTHTRSVEQPRYFTENITPALSVTWEAKPEVSQGPPDIWVLERQRMVFMVQKAPLNQPFSQWVEQMAEQDRTTVGGAVQDPLEITENTARYSFFDAENRIQAHRVYLSDNQWVKISVLYKPSMESRKLRANYFLDNIKWLP